jgi:hypothetical protein
LGAAPRTVCEGSLAKRESLTIPPNRDANTTRGPGRTDGLLCQNDSRQRCAPFRGAKVAHQHGAGYYYYPSSTGLE